MGTSSTTSLARVGATGELPLRIPVNWESMLPCRDVVDDITLRLHSPRPVRARGVARLRILLSDGPAVLSAQKGRYDMETERVGIEGPVQFEAAGGYRLPNLLRRMFAEGAFAQAFVPILAAVREGGER